MTRSYVTTQHERTADLERRYMASRDAWFNVIVAQQADLTRAAAELESRVREVLSTSSILTNWETHARALRGYRLALRLIADNAPFFTTFEKSTS